jgi:hypothetical protein
VAPNAARRDGTRARNVPRRLEELTAMFFMGPHRVETDAQGGLRVLSHVMRPLYGLS